MVPGRDPGVCPVCEETVSGGCHVCPGPQAVQDLLTALAGHQARRLDVLARRFQEFIDANAGQDPPPAEHFTIDGAASYRVTQGQWRELMELAPQEIRGLNDANPPSWPGQEDQLRPGRLTAEQENLIARLTTPQPGEQGLGRQEQEQEQAGRDDDPEPGQPMIQLASLSQPPPVQVPGLTDRPAGTWFALLDPSVRRLLLDIEAVDTHLDEAGPAWAKACPEANMYRRVGKAQLEAAEAMEELALLTGENPRKGQDPDAAGRMLAELGDTAVAALLGIQSQVKNLSRTWAIFLAALDKAHARVLRHQQAAEGCGGTCSCHGDTGSAICGTCCSGQEPQDAVFPPESGMSDEHARDNGITG